jgi:hypothetical protein
LSFRRLYRNVKVKIYKTIILPVVLYCCETWSLTLREEHRLRVFENSVLRTISRPKRDEVTGELRKLHNEELHNLFSSPNIIRQIKSRRMKWVGHEARTGEERKCTKLRWKSPKERGHSEDRGVDGRMGSEWIFVRLATRMWSGFSWLRIGTGSEALVNTVLNPRVLAPRSE